MEGMTRGARIFGDKGCFGDPDPCLGVVFWLDSSLTNPVLGVFVSDIAISALSSNAGPDMHDSMLSPNTCWRQLLPGALIDRSWIGGRPGIVGESIAISCTVVMGPSSGTLTFLRRMSVCSFGFVRTVPPSIDRSFSACPIVDDRTVSGSGLFRPAVIESLSFAGNNWYFLDSDGWCILHTYVSFSSAGVTAPVAAS